MREQIVECHRTPHIHPSDERHVRGGDDTPNRDSNWRHDNSKQNHHQKQGKITGSDQVSLPA